MARYRMCIFVAVAVLVVFSDGKDAVSPAMEQPPLLNFTEAAGDDRIDQFDTATEVTLNFNISFFGSLYNSIYISSDGIIGFAPQVRFLPDVQWSEGIRNLASDRPFMAPFYHESYNPVTIGHQDYQGQVYYRVIYADDLAKADAEKDIHYTRNKELITYFSNYVPEATINAPTDFKAEVVVIVTWHDVTDKDSAGAPDCDKTPSMPCKSATFQAVIVADRMGNTYAVFNYLHMDIPYHESYQAGFNGGYERGWFNVIPCHGACAVALNKSRVNDLDDLKGSDYQGRYVLNVGDEMIMRGGCLPSSLHAGMLEVYPREVGMFGGERLEVSGKCLSATSKIYCKFGEAGNSQVTTGAMTNDMKGYCHVPILTTRGQTKVSWSSDGKDWSAEKDIAVVMPDKAKEPVELNGQDKSAWYQRDSSTITVNWSPARMSAKSDARVAVKLIGYRETGNKVEFKELENFGEVSNTAGKFSFQTASHSCTENCQDFEMGLLEVGLRQEDSGDASNRVALRFGPIPLGWYVNKAMEEKDGSDWSDQMCRRWRDEDQKSMDWLKDLPRCPCNLDQVLADFGRWQAGDSCNVLKGTDCFYHKTAKHCVRSVTPTAEGAGNQCCYGEDGALIYSQLSHQGSTPDRGHDWGMFPYNMPGRVPSLSHWRHDVIPFYYCCLWNEYSLCDLYTRQRPTTDCDAYEAPGLAFVRGDPHITTFDGQTYNFGGRGDYWLLQLPGKGVEIQGVFEARKDSWDLGKMRLSDKTSWKPTALTSLAILGAGEIVEIHPAPANANPKRGVDIRVGKDRHMFLTETTKWQDFPGQSIINNALDMATNAHNNFTVITKNVGIQVVALNNLLHVTVVLPPSFKVPDSDPAKGLGLMGMFDGNITNDFVAKDGQIFPLDEQPDELYKSFAMSWAVVERDSMFPHPKDPSKYKNHKPYFTYDDIPHDFDQAPSDSQINDTCGDDDDCMWDYRITGSSLVAKATKEANIAFSYSQESVFVVENLCGLPTLGELAVLNSNNFSAGASITVTGCSHGHSFNGSATFTCVMEPVEAAKGHNRGHYGRHVTDEDVEYVIHWVPEPFEVCHVEECDPPALGQAAVLNSRNFKVGESVRASDCNNDNDVAPKAVFACVRERLDVAKKEKRGDYGRKTTDNNVDYVIHWVPKPFDVCSASESSNTGMIAGIVVAVIVVIIIIVVVVVLMMRRKKASKNIQGDKAAKGRQAEEGTNEPMMSSTKGL